MEDVTAVATKGGVEELQVASANLEKGKQLLDDNPEKAVELLSSVVQTFEKHYGSMSIECAPAYLHYGIALYEVARNDNHALGAAKTSVRPAAERKGDQAAAGASDAGPGAERAGTGDADASAQGAEQADMAAAITPEAEGVSEGGSGKGGVAALGSKKDVAATKEADDAKADNPDDDDKGEEAGRAKQGEEGEEDGEDEEDGNGDVDEGGREEETGEEGAAGDGDDMKLAWELVELARVVYSKDNPDQHRSMLAEVHKTLGDIKSEQEHFKEAVECYKQSVEYMEAMELPSKRRIAEVQYKMSLVYTFLDLPHEAITQARAAIVYLEGAVAEEEDKLSALPTDGSGGEEAEQEGRRLQQTIDDLRSVMTELHYNIEGHQDTIAHNNKWKEALKDSILELAGLGAAGGPAGGGAASSNAFDAPSKPASTAEPIAAGVVGMGKKKLTIEPTAPASVLIARQPLLPAANVVAAALAKHVAGKRTLADLMGVAPLPGAEAASGFGAVAVVEKVGDEQPPKKVRTEEQPPAASAAPADAVTSGVQEMEAAAK